ESVSKRQEDLAGQAALGEPVCLSDVGQREALDDRDDELLRGNGASERRQPPGVRVGGDGVDRHAALFGAAWLAKNAAENAAAFQLRQKLLNRLPVDRVGDCVDG